MSCVPVRGCRIGEGRPKVILPIVERTEAAILEKAAVFSTLCADCVEWRVDLFEAAADPGAVVHCLAKLRVLLKEKLLLVTLRTKEEGGSIPVSHEGYLRFLRTVLDTDCADLIDIEFFTAGADLPAVGSGRAHRRGQGRVLQPRLCQDPAQGRDALPDGGHAAGGGRPAQAGRDALLPLGRP